MAKSQNDTSPLNLVSELVSAYVSKNSLSPSELPQLINTVHEALRMPEQAAASVPEPAVPIKKSIRPDYVICLEDGKKLKMLKRHLRTAFNMTPDEYRRKWGLSSDYPMVAPKYSARRSELAKIIGLGRKPGQKVKGKKVAK
jgi:predicted transcriptional regulator